MTSGTQKHLVATSVASGVHGQGTPIQLVGLQMNPGSRNLTATVSAASSHHSQTATILTSSAGPKLPVHRLTSCPQLVRTLSGSSTGTTTLKLTQTTTGGLQVQQGGNATTGGIFGE